MAIYPRVAYHELEISMPILEKDTRGHTTMVTGIITKRPCSWGGALIRKKRNGPMKTICESARLYTHGRID
jgi:hypothetical protein